MNFGIQASRPSQSNRFLRGGMRTRFDDSVPPDGVLDGVENVMVDRAPGPPMEGGRRHTDIRVEPPQDAPDIERR